MVSFSSLPTEIHWRILYFTDLVLPLQTIGAPQGLLIVDGYLSQHRESNHLGDWQINNPFPKELFFINRHLSLLAREIVFSQNRFILNTYDGWRTGFEWLNTIPAHYAKMIRHLDIRLKFWNVERPASPGGLLCNLVKSLDRLNLPQLTLSIDGAHNYLDVVKDCPDGDFEYLKGYYRTVVSDLGVGNLRSCKAFFVFWPKYRSMEIEAEKAIMGEDYDSATLGKVPYRDRDWRLPHGWEWAPFDNDDGEYWDELNPELTQWSLYDREWMRDVEPESPSTRDTQ